MSTLKWIAIAVAALFIKQNVTSEAYWVTHTSNPDCYTLKQRENADSKKCTLSVQYLHMSLRIYILKCDMLFHLIIRGPN